MRLIDADALMRKLTYSPNGVRYREFDCDNFPSTLTLRDAKKLVREEPTIGPIPDPITGLVPCGCGGKVDVAFYPGWHGVPDMYQVDCFNCHVGTRPCQTAEQAKAAWNTAMGRKGGAE